MKYSILLVVLLALVACSKKEVEIEITSIPLGEPSLMRGLFMVDDDVAWASGTKGIIRYSGNGKDWVAYKDTLFKDLDFRDIHAFSEKEAIIMSSGNGCKIYKTKDQCESWQIVYENTAEGIFFDGMDFWDDKNGIAFSDPINNQLFIITTQDGGDTWQKLSNSSIPSTLNGEAGFAASGTGITCVGDSTVFIGTGGGAISRIFKSTNRGKTWSVTNTNMRAGEASGIYSMLFVNNHRGIAIGGNYLDSTNINGNCIVTINGGQTWVASQKPPLGYKSCVADNGDGILISTGRTGVDVSSDNGYTWKHVSDDAYYSCVIKGKKGWLSGKNKMAQIIIH
ncbi:MAG: hypothetical protein P1U41_05355 [Vicingaceae bacterium]|nr:hypothetical protein [Vicingaceae bacterium]